MAKQKGYFLTAKDLKEWREDRKLARAGKAAPSRRPTATRRRTRESPGSVVADMLYGTVGSYDAGNQVITTTGTPTPLPTGTPAISAGIKVYDREGDGFSASDTFYAIKSVAVHTDGTHGQVDWVVLPFAPGQNPTVNVQLYQNTKGRSDSPVNVKLLEDDLTDAGLDAVSCYDPHGEFSAGLADDAVGRATLVRDADTGTTRLEFTHLKGPAAWVCATLDENMGATTSGEATATVNSYHGLDWSNEDPADGSGDVTVIPCSGMHTGLQSSDKVVAVLKDPDTDPIEYLIVEADSTPSLVLLAKLTSTVTARSSDNYGSASSVALGHLVAGVWTQVLTGQTVYNPSLSPVHIPSGANIQIPVASSNGQWVLLNATDLQQVKDWTTANNQSIGHDAASTSVEWQDDGSCPE